MSWNANRHCENGVTKSSKMFGLVRPVNGDSKQVFGRFLKDLENGAKLKDRVTSSQEAGVKILTRGMVSDAVQAMTARRIEAKDINRWRQETIDSLGCRALHEVTLDLRDIDLVATGRNKNIGAFIVRRSSDWYDQLVEEHIKAVAAVRERAKAERDYTRRAAKYKPRLDIFDVDRQDEARVALAAAEEILSEIDEFHITLAGVEPYLPPRH